MRSYRVCIIDEIPGNRRLFRRGQHAIVIAGRRRRQDRGRRFALWFQRQRNGSSRRGDRTVGADLRAHARSWFSEHFTGVGA